MFKFGKRREKASPVPSAPRYWNGNEICPRLGLIDSPETFCSYPSVRNVCHASGKHPTEIPLDHQQSFCLSGQYGRCEILNRNRQLASGRREAPEAARGRLAAAVSIAEDRTR